MVDFKMVGVILTVFVGIVVGLAIFTGGISTPVAQITQTVSETQTITMPATTTPVTLRGQAATGVTVINATNASQTVPASNYSVANYVVSNGALITQLSSTGAGVWNGTSVNVSYTSEPYGYARDAGSRAMTSLIIIFAALAVAVFAMTPVLRNGILDMFK